VADLLKDASAWLEGMTTTFASSPVEYKRGENAKTVNASFGYRDYEIVDESGLSVGSHVCDFLILAGELGFQPEAGDAITADGRKYEVMNLGDEGCWRWNDSFGQTYRIHTKGV